MVSKLIENNANVNFSFNRKECLYRSIELIRSYPIENENIFNLLLENKANPNSIYAIPIIRYSIQNNLKKCVETLISFGARNLDGKKKQIFVFFIIIFFTFSIDELQYSTSLSSCEIVFFIFINLIFIYF